MSKLDIVVFGATGFTGRLVVDKLVSLCDKHPYTELSFGVAGRSEEKLLELVKQLEEAGLTTKLPTIVADASDEGSLLAMARQAKVVMNCTGPYTVLGEPVVKACIESGAHYVDMTAELHFMLRMYQKYHLAAEAAGVVVVTACGFGSVPGVLGMVHLEQQFKGTLNSVDCYSALEIPRRALLPGCGNTLVHYGTWASLVYEFQNFREYTARKNTVFPEDVYEPETERKRSFLHRHEGRFWFPYPGPDHDIVDMTERYLQEKRGKKPARFKIYTTTPWFIHLLLLLPVFFFYYYASACRFFRRLLWRFPKFFTLGYISHEGPSKRNMEQMKFSFVFTGHGVEQAKDESEEKRSLTVKVSGADPYAITALVFTLAAITVVKEHSTMPKGGVLTSGAAFYDTQYIQRLNEHGLNFEVLEADSNK